MDSSASKGGNAGSVLTTALTLTPSATPTSLRLHAATATATAAGATATGPAGVGDDKHAGKGEGGGGALLLLPSVDKRGRSTSRQGSRDSSTGKPRSKEDRRRPSGLLPSALSLGLGLGGKGGAKDGPASLGARLDGDEEGVRGAAPDSAPSAGGRFAGFGHVRRWSKTESKASGRHKNKTLKNKFVPVLP